MYLEDAAIVAAAVAAFVATSLDNLLILVGFQTSGTIPRRAIAAGYILAVGLVCALALGLASAAEDVLPFSLSWLGLAPLAIGVHHGVRAFRVAPETNPTGIPHQVRPEDLTVSERLAAFLSVLLTMLANSGDSLLVVVALLGDTRSRLDWWVVGTLMGMSAIWAASARWLSRRPRLQVPLRGFARYGLPVMLVGIGLYILMDTPTDLPIP